MERKPEMGSKVKNIAKKTNAGFTLLEALVALAILATSGTALLVFYSNAINGLIRATEIQETLLLAENLQPLFNTLTLQEETEQQMEFNGYQVHWHAKPVEPKQQGRNSNGAMSRFIMGLYDIEVTINKDDREIDRYTTRNVSWQLIQGEGLQSGS